jgi:putative phage-type endonuclease
MIVECEQQSPEWLLMRTGIVTGSRVCDVMAKLKRKEGEAACRQNYRAELVCEILTGRSAEHYVSPAMQWGMDNEVLARNAYEIEFDVQTIQVGFAVHPEIRRFGASPDGLVGTDGLVEFKCPTTQTHIDYIISGEIPTEYRWQMFAEMACAERQWCDFVSYDPRLPKSLQLFVRRLERDDSCIREMEAEVLSFLSEVDFLIERLKKSKPINTNTLLQTLQDSVKEARL